MLQIEAHSSAGGNDEAYDSWVLLKLQERLLLVSFIHLPSDRRDKNP